MANNKSFKEKTPVRIREKKLANGNISLYLDIYREGKRSYEFLKLYIVPETGSNKAELKTQNKNTWSAAEAIKSQRIIDIASHKADIAPSNGSKMLLQDWMQQYKTNQDNKGKEGTRQITFTAKLLYDYGGAKTRLKDVDKDFVLGFIDYITHTYRKPDGMRLKTVTTKNYYRSFNCALNAAIRAKLINHNPCTELSDTERITVPESKRSYLTIEEVRKMIKTDCRNEEVKRAFLFACFCGLRISDIERLKWQDLTKTNDQWRAEVVMKKTKDPIYLPLSTEAMKWIPTRSAEAKDEDCVFVNLPSESSGNRIIKEWAASAGIKKNVSYHVGRHTFATMMLTLNADLYTVSKLLGHSDTSVTQIYAKIVDEKKNEAVNLTTGLFND